MTKVRFCLQTPKEAESLIRLVLRYAGEKLVFYPGYKIKAADWNGKEMRVRRSARHAAEINAGLSRLSSECERLYLEHKAAGNPYRRVRVSVLMPKNFAAVRGGIISGQPSFLCFDSSAIWADTCRATSAAIRSRNNSNSASGSTRRGMCWRLLPIVV